MAKKENLLQMLSMQLGPEKLQQMAAAATQQLMTKVQGMSPDAVGKIIKMLEYVMDNPEEYPRMLKEGMQSGALQPGVLPPRFDPIKIGLLLLAFYGVMSMMMRQQGRPMPGQQAPQMQMARGGLAAAARMGRHGDTMLAHISPREAMMLRQAGGSGTINPQTGLPEFFFDFGSIFSSIGDFASSALSYVDDVVTNMNWGDVATGALTGAATSALTGGNPLVGAVTGGLGQTQFATDLGSAIGGLGSIGQSVVNALGAQNLGAGIFGGIGGALSGQNPLLSALTTGGQTAALNALGATTPAIPTSSTPPMVGSPSAGPMGGNVSPGVQLTQDMLKGTPYNPMGGDVLSAPIGTQGIAGPVTQAASPLGKAAEYMNIAKLGLGAAALFSGMNATQAKEQVQKSAEYTPEQKAALNRALDEYVVTRGLQQLPTQGTPEYDQYAQELQRGVERNWFTPTAIEKKKRGGVSRQAEPVGILSKVSRVVAGPGSGRDDLINAQLSDGEYVIDAETVALLGDGSTDTGAKRLDDMRAQLRKHKGKALSKGKFSPDAKGPLSYMKGGLR